jgi:mannose-6-phosphate isomerase-like protein (cupin superfamily)
MTIAPDSINTEIKPRLLAPGEGQTVGLLGVTLTFKIVGAESGGQWLVAEYTAPPQLAGPPPHVHKTTTEIFHVLEGALVMQANGQSTQLGPGGCAYIPPGTAHTFANPTDAPTRFLLIASPAGLEHYFAEVAELVRNEPSWPPKNMGKIVALMAKYDTFPPSARP